MVFLIKFVNKSNKRGVELVWITITLLLTIGVIENYFHCITLYIIGLDFLSPFQ